MIKIKLVFYIIFFVMFIALTSSITSAEIKSNPWKVEDVKKEWQFIQKYYAPIPDIEFYISNDSLGRAYTTCSNAHVFPCPEIKMFLPNTDDTEYLQSILYHEAGHVYHFYSQDVVTEYVKFRKINDNYKKLWYEFFADDFKECAGYKLYSYDYHYVGAEYQPDVCRIVTPIIYKNYNKYINNKILWWKEYIEVNSINNSIQYKLAKENNEFRKIYNFSDYTKEQLIEMGLIE